MDDNPQMQQQELVGLIYMDHAATTPTHPEVWREMSLWFHEYFGNPATMYALGDICEVAVEKARQQVASLIGAEADEIYFTCGGTESDNWAVKGTAYAREAKGKHIISTPIEHHAVFDTCKFMEKQGFEVTYLPVDSYGMVAPDDVAKAIRDDTILVTIMHANNEVGTIQPIADIANVTRESEIPLHTDAVQTVGKIPVDVNDFQCDMLSISAHKFSGPKGVGALYVRKGTRIEPYMHGGGQERKRRAGTLNVPGIVGMGKGAEIAASHLAEERVRVAALRDKLRDGVLDQVPDLRVNGHPTERLPGNLHLCVEGIEGEAMILCLSMNLICVSSGSACTTGSLDPSHVLLAMGMPAEMAHSSLRLTLGSESIEAHIPYFLDVFPPIVERLRKMSPTYKAKG